MGQILGMKCRIYFLNMHFFCKAINIFTKLQLVSAEIRPRCTIPMAACCNFNYIVIFCRRLQLQ
jgi:hypothetical protein